MGAKTVHDGVRAGGCGASAVPVLLRVAAVTRWVQQHLIALAYLVLASGLLFYAYRLEITTKETNDIIKNELAARDATIASLNLVLDTQAVPASVFFAQYYKKSTGTEVNLLFGPQYPPFEPPKEG